MMPPSERRAAGDESTMLLSRIRSEFLEMPGLKLTVRQAARLWGLERATSERLLARLADAGFLWRSRDGAYTRMSER
jgi:DNA-binding IclR family transcriptional regulator